MSTLKQKIISKLSKIIYPVLKIYWKTFKPKRRGVKCVISCGDEVLLIRNTYGGKLWTFPGGGIKRKEAPEVAVKREVKEEVGIVIENLQLVGELDWGQEGKKDTIYCFATKVENKDFKIDTTEILEAKWFPVSAIPVLPPFAQKIFNKWQEVQSV